LKNVTKQPLKDTYHHGDLRRAVMDEALRQTAAHGIDGWSLREVAAAVGVSHTAPYHHFGDRTDLVRALGCEGLGLMDLRMAERQATTGDDPKEQLLAIGLAYITFAVDRPDYYAAIGAMPALPASGAPTDEAGPKPEATWQRLVEAVVACQRADRLPAGDPVIIAVSLWSLVHGLAELWMAGPLRLLPHAADGLLPLAERVLRASVDSMSLGAHTELHGESS
jgi:AcrR family transcriptional regulator